MLPPGPRTRTQKDESVPAFHLAGTDLDEYTSIVSEPN